MLIPHFEDRCISCLQRPPFNDGSSLTEEHVIPRALGGILRCAFLCHACNKEYGHTFERKARRDPAIRLAIHSLRNEIPDLYRRIEEDQPKVRSVLGEMLPDINRGEMLTPLVSLKIAYEFAVLSFGKPMLSNENPALREIRRVLLQGDTGSPVFNVENMVAKDGAPRPFHGIVFEGNNPHAVIQVRLFGYLAYRVHFPNLSIDNEPSGYTHTLDHGKEWQNSRDQEKASRHRRIGEISSG